MRWPRVFTPNNLNYQGIAIGWSSKLFNIEKSVYIQVGYDMTKKAADYVFKKSGLTPEDVDVVELHDCFSANELITYEALGLCEEGR